MGKGIATLFKNKFGGVKELKSQGRFHGAMTLFCNILLSWCHVVSSTTGVVVSVV